MTSSFLFWKHIDHFRYCKWMICLTHRAFCLFFFNPWHLKYWVAFYHIGMTLRVVNVLGLPWWLSNKESACQCRRHGLDPWSREIPDTSKHLSPNATAVEPLLWSLGTWTIEAHAPQQEKPQQWEAWALTIERWPHSPQLEKNQRNNKDPAQPKIKQINFFFKKE